MEGAVCCAETGLFADRAMKLTLPSSFFELETDASSLHTNDKKRSKLLRTETDLHRTHRMDTKRQRETLTDPSSSRRRRRRRRRRRPRCKDNVEEWRDWASLPRDVLCSGGATFWLCCQATAQDFGKSTY
jgi:hypothetical protein